MLLTLHPGPMGAGSFGATAGVLLLAWRERDKHMKQTATGALAAGPIGLSASIPR